MKKSLTALILAAFIFSTGSKADSDVFFNLGIGLGLPAPVFVAPYPVVYAPAFASASLVSRISPNTFLSFSIGVPAPVFVVPSPVVLASPVFTYPSGVVHPAPLIIHEGPRHIHIHGHPYGGPPGHFKHKVHYHGHKGFKIKHKHR